MNAIAKPLAYLALAVTFLAPLLTAFGKLGDGPMKAAMLIATVVWFASAPFALKGGTD